MADLQSTDTSTEAAANEDVESKALEDMDVNFDSFGDDDDDTSDESESTDESSQAQADDDETDEESEDSTDQTETEDSEASDDSTEDESEQETDKANKPKTEQAAHNKAMFEKRQHEKEAREANAKTQAQEQQAYLDEADSDEQLALRQLQIDAYDNKVDRNSTKMTTGYERAIKDFDILRSTNPDIRLAVDEAIDEFQERYVTIDKYGNPITLKPGADMYAFLEKKADSLAKLTGLGKTTQKQSKSKERSKTITAPSAAPKQGKTDADMDAFLEEAKR